MLKQHTSPITSIMDEKSLSFSGAKKPHVVLVNVWRVVNAKGGTEKVFCDMANALVKRGYEVTALFCDPNQGAPGFHVDKNVRCINSFQKPPLPFLYKNPWRNLRCLRLSKLKRKLLRDLLNPKWRAKCIAEAIAELPKTDIFISYQAESTWILRNCLNIKTPLVTMFHSNPICYFNASTFHTYRKALESTDALQVLLPEYIAETKAWLPNTRIVAIPNIAPKYNESANLSIKRIITVARIDSPKRPHLLLEAFALLKDHFPDWICEWYGERIDETFWYKIEHLIHEKGLSDRMFFRGTTNNIAGVLQNASIFAFPSLYEGFPLALAEAFSMGLPAVGCKDCSGVNSLIKDGSNGFLTDPTPKAFAEGLAKLMMSEDLRRQLGAQGRQDMKAFSADAVWGAWDKLIRELISEQREVTKTQMQSSAS